MKKYQIGIMGSAADLNYSQSAKECAIRLGELIAESNNILVYGAEKEYSSLSTNAAIAADKKGGLTVGITYGKDRNTYGDFKPTILIPCGLEIGGGREFTLILACDAIIAISGGSGTLTEMAIAYQANIPIVVIDQYGGWAKKLSNKYLDKRHRLKCLSAKTPEEALNKVLKILKERSDTNENSKC